MVRGREYIDISIGVRYLDTLVSTSDVCNLRHNYVVGRRFGSR